MENERLITELVDLIERKNAAPLESARRRLLVRGIAMLRYSCEEAGPLIEELDPDLWGR